VPKSDAFIRIKADILKIVAAIPAGRVSTYRSIGAHLDVAPRHVAYILTMLTADEKARLPWYRVVCDAGKLGTEKFDHDGRSQALRLQEEGVDVLGKAIRFGFDAAMMEAGALKSGVPKQTRPEATRTSARRSKT
jgi:methylated-DNA-protein-cysteine methyltransferase related protein